MTFTSSAFPVNLTEADTFAERRESAATERCSLIPFGDLYESVLYKLGYSRHGVRIDLDAGKQVFVSPMVDCRGGSAQLDLHPAFHEIRDKFLVRVAVDTLRSALYARSCNVTCPARE